eukprot:761637-Hanusia_phi.AAC.1
MDETLYHVADKVKNFAVMSQEGTRSGRVTQGLLDQVQVLRGRRAGRTWDGMCKSEKLLLLCRLRAGDFWRRALAACLLDNLRIKLGEPEEGGEGVG